VNEDKDRLVLVVTAFYKGAVGFGEIFECEVSHVVAGTIDQPTIRLSILAGDKNRLSFITRHLYPARIEIGFEMHRKGEPYSMAPISGFVDQSRTSWQIEYICEAYE
jgi:hypothetical protein